MPGGEGCRVGIQIAISNDCGVVFPTSRLVGWLNGYHYGWLFGWLGRVGLGWVVEWLSSRTVNH